MKQPLEITFRGMPRSEAVEAKVQQKAEKLDEFYDHIMACHVVVEAPHKHHHQGNLFNVTIDLTVPGSEIVVNKNSNKDHSHEDVYVAIRDAFNAARRTVAMVLPLSQRGLGDLPEL